MRGRGSTVSAAIHPTSKNPSPILYSAAQGTGATLEPVVRVHSFFPRVSINLFRGRQTLQNPQTNAPVTPPAETPEINHFIHAFLSVIVSRRPEEKASEGPMGGSREAIWYDGRTCIGEKRHLPTTHVLFCAILVTSLLPSCETRPHAEIRSLFSGLTQWLLKEKGRIMTLVFCLWMFRHQMNGRRSRHCFWKSRCCSGFVPIVQKCFYKLCKNWR